MKDEYKAVGSWGTLGLDIVLSVMIGFFGTAPWLSVVGFVFGCGAAGKAIYRTWKEMAAVTAREERERGNPAPRYERRQDREGSPKPPPDPTVPEATEDDHAE